MAARRAPVAGALLIAVMAVGSATLWIGVPVGCSWVAAQLTSDQTTHLQITVPLTIAAMVLLARGLFWLNRLYVEIGARVAEPVPDPVDDEEGEGGSRFLRGPLEPILVISLVIALIALTVWFFVLAENPPQLVY